MTETVSVVIGTFGDRDFWCHLARRAFASAEAQDPKPAEITMVHEESLSLARNRGARLSSGDWLCFLDADDELEPGYIAEMLKAEGDLRYPSVRYIPWDSSKPPESYTPTQMTVRPLLTGNYMVIGTLVRREQFLRVGGFDEWPAYEDWALWIKCWIDGAKAMPAEKAVYRAYRRPDGRNVVKNPAVIFYQIKNAYLGLAKEKGLA
jgi:glycosyltransferase involved in cell wall biosynthesis